MAASIDIKEIYDLLPLTERTLLKRYKGYPFKIANDRGGPCDWWIYDEVGKPVGVVLYRGGRKLCLHGYKERASCASA